MRRSTTKSLKHVTKEEYLKVDVEGLNYDTETIGFRKSLCFIDRFYDNDGKIITVKAFFPNRKKVFFLA